MSSTRQLGLCLTSCRGIASNILFSFYSGLSKLDAKLIFAKAKMAGSDEFKRRQRFISHYFMDFLEALARMADWISLPTQEELQQWSKLNRPTTNGEAGTGDDHAYWVYNKRLLQTVGL